MNAIFTYSNFQVDPIIRELQEKVINKFNSGKYDYKYLYYNAPDGQIIPSQVIDYGLKELFNQGYTNVLILDIDCVPLSFGVLDYVFDQASKGILIGNAQRSNHIENNQHVYPAPSAICFSLDTFNKLGNLSFAPTNRGDVGEELAYAAEYLNIKIELFLPKSYEDLPINPDRSKCSLPWDLADGMPKFGIGTTFVNNNMEMFYHLFQSRVHIYNHLFISKCNQILQL